MSEPRTGALARVVHAWRTLTSDARLAAVAALALFVTMLLPWYQVQGRVVDKSVTAFGAFSFVEAAVLLVAIAVLALLFARAEDRAFHLPGGDGTVVMAAGAWVALLLVWRLFDKPDADALVGVQFGIFLALAAAGVLAYAGSQMRRSDRSEPPLAAPRRRPRTPPPMSPPPPPGTTVTRVLPPERPARKRQQASDDQLTIPLPPSDEPG